MGSGSSSGGSSSGTTSADKKPQQPTAPATGDTKTEKKY
jgi:hypothetical protein